MLLNVGSIRSVIVFLPPRKTKRVSASGLECRSLSIVPMRSPVTILCDWGPLPRLALGFASLTGSRVFSFEQLRKFSRSYGNLWGSVVPEIRQIVAPAGTGLVLPLVRKRRNFFHRLLTWVPNLFRALWGQNRSAPASSPQEPTVSLNSQEVTGSDP